MIGEVNVVAGWLTLPLGIFSGAILSLWAFDGPLAAPPGHEDYCSLPRRMVRLAHVALVMLPVINILYGQHLDSLPLANGTKYFGAHSMIVLMIGIPLFLVLSSWKAGFKYVNVLPVTAGLCGLLVMAYGQCLRWLAQ